MPEIQDASLARALARRYFIKGGYTPVLAPEVVPVVLVDDISGYETSVGRSQPGIWTTESAAVAGQFGHTSLAPLAGQVCRVTRILFAAGATGVYTVRFGAPLTGGTPIAPLWTDRRLTGTPPVDARFVANVAAQGTTVMNLRVLANEVRDLRVDYLLTNAQALLTHHATVNVAYRVTLEFELMD